jgi:NAD(P)H-nitrite reductase large subunit
MNRSDYLIIGNSVAAVGAVEAIRQADIEGSIVVVSDEPHHVYSRPRISECLTNRASAESLSYRPSDFYQSHAVMPVLGVTAKEINNSRKTVRLKNGRTLSYKKLLFATGSRPAKPPIPGIDLPGVHYFTTLADAERLARDLSDIQAAVVIGGGLIGLQAAEALAAAGVGVTVVEMLDRILAQVVDERASSLVEARLAEHGISILTSCRVDEIVGGRSGVSEVRLNNGTHLDCRAVVVAVGVTPRTELAESAGIKVNKGIPVDTFMQTSESDIYAAGDVAETLELLSGENRLIPIWPNAYAEGRAAGLAMAGRPTPYPGGISINAAHFAGFPIASAGFTSAVDGCTELAELNERTGYYRRIILKESVPIGMVVTGDAVERSGLIAGLIRNKTDVSSFVDKLARADFNTAHLPRELRIARQMGREVA